MKKVLTKTAIERFMLTNKSWSDGYRRFTRLLGNPSGWLCVFIDGHIKIMRLDHKKTNTFFSKSKENEEAYTQFLHKYFTQLRDNEEQQKQLPYFFRCAYGRQNAIFGLWHLDQLRGFLFLSDVNRKLKDMTQNLFLVNYFLTGQVELAYKNYELHNFYETVHPRALALSTMHSVNRIISSQLRLRELLPQIGRLFAQVLKCGDCAIYFVDGDGAHLSPQFILQDRKAVQNKHRIKLGRGLEGRVAETAEFYFSKKAICIPLIGEDVLGIVTMSNKMDQQPFAEMDLEILKALSEQAVVAIRNAKLFDETEALTVSSIQAINQLLELSYGNSHARLPLFGEMVFEIGRDLKFSSMELTHLHRATFIIDTGHLVVPEKILTKKTNLTKLEYDQIKRHPQLGADILNKVGALQPVIPIILNHHERYDGKGYPNGLKGDQIPFGARVISLVDAFTAMLSYRPYRKQKTLKEAIGEIKHHAGTQFDPRVVESFLKVVGKPEILKKARRLLDRKGYEAD
ncbi:MAG: hypothetical protein COV74_05265 [Candidatus Omnitrophica bacterium CG11_big_fil_rev_8_21_14_0_20_45_26]|uniref:HD-GYP domain-containing protein n=1 Tax=Candidatus Abzuiibacterium crystallinum TaxID=1974748 RepID=A0A2H0LS18_9BACT|nr:MAG: hypothetical protein COV74_05265 [Candidatus Omnitrophica bacterium CG11_big_fil_rev_8_21_14_0_20_45_26]PIW64300.1 MAG: hypothetical protein COW12_06585 [Candidatus Omnitrophica bacterium CG12_big_fil_rev_8_21_14_0_65_45_16]